VVTVHIWWQLLRDETPILLGRFRSCRRKPLRPLPFRERRGVASHRLF